MPILRSSEKSGGGVVVSFRHFALALLLAFVLPSFALAGQTVIIDNGADGNVVGNGDHFIIANLADADPDDYLDPNDNTVIVNSGTVDGNVSGGYAKSGSGSAVATGNSVFINDGTVNGSDVHGGYAQSDSGSATATGNSVTINGGMVNNYVSGGYSRSSTVATSTGNSVTINGGEVVESVFGGNAYSAITGNVVVVGNTVTVNGGKVNRNVIGGRAYTNSGIATATGNSVTINGGEIGGYVAGGRANVKGNDMDRITATNNTVTISGTPLFSATTSLYGATIDEDEDRIAPGLFTGNTLNVWNYAGTAVASVQNFEFYNFTLPASSLKGLEVSGTAFLHDKNGRASTVTGVSVVGGAAPVQPGTDVTLINAGALNATDFTQTKAQGKHGATLLYDWTLNADNNKLTAALNSVQLNPQTKALSEGFLGGLALAIQGADLVAGQGMANAVGAAGGGFGTFAALSGASLRHNTGSHADMNSLSLIAGLARGTDTGYGRLTGGVFAEFGTGAYDTFNAFGNASVNGDGDAHHIGGGILGRMDFAAAGCGNWYAEASARLGAMRNDYRSSDLRDGMGRGAGYDASSLYYSLHAGTGYVRSIGEKASLDFSAKYFWTRQGGDDVTLATGDPVRFAAADSHRLRLGGRYVYALNDCVSPYAGAAYEYEFDGKANASTYGHAIDAPSLRGGTGMAELGIRYSQPGDRGVSVDAGVQGYVGKREGVTGSLRLGWAF